MRRFLIDSSPCELCAENLSLDLPGSCSRAAVSGQPIRARSLSSRMRSGVCRGRSDLTHAAEPPVIDAATRWTCFRHTSAPARGAALTDVPMMRAGETWPRSLPPAGWRTRRSAGRTPAGSRCGNACRWSTTCIRAGWSGRRTCHWRLAPSTCEAARADGKVRVILGLEGMRSRATSASCAVGLCGTSSLVHDNAPGFGNTGLERSRDARHRTATSTAPRPHAGRAGDSRRA